MPINPLSFLYILFAAFASSLQTSLQPLTLSTINKKKKNNNVRLKFSQPMDEQKGGAKPEAEKKPAADSGAKKDDGKVTAIYKIDMHCEGCAKKIKRVIKHCEGVEDVKTDCGANKLAVIGKVDPAKVRVRLAEKLKKKVDLISPQPNKDAVAAGGGDKKPDAEKKPEEKKEGEEEDKKATEESTVVLKIRTQHCEVFIPKIRRIILNFDGVQSVNVDGSKDFQSVNVDGSKDLVTVEGIIDVVTELNN